MPTNVTSGNCCTVSSNSEFLHVLLVSDVVQLGFFLRLDTVVSVVGTSVGAIIFNCL